MEKTMFYCPYRSYANEYKRAERTPSHIRMLNAVPNAKGIDIYINDNIAVRNLVYKEFSEYLPLQPGYYNIKVYPSGMKITPIINTNISVSSQAFLTAAIIGISPNMSLLTIPENAAISISGRACTRFVHLSPNSPSVDITSLHGDRIFSNIAYKGYSDYSCILPEKYSLQVRLAGTNEIILIDPHVNLLPNKYYSIYAVGLSGGSPPLQILIALDGRSYISR